jgi:hypothetical protein
VAKQWAQADAAANLLEETKSADLEQRKSEIIAERGDMPDNKVERLVRGSPVAALAWISMDNYSPNARARSGAR